MKTILIIVVFVIVGIVGVGAASKLVSGNVTISKVSSEADETLLTLTIAGQVANPGTYKLSAGKTVIDLITMAGGTTSNADTLTFTTTHVLESKENYYIAPIYDNANTCSSDPITKVNINTASADDLRNVAGFSKTVSAAVVSYRSGNPFETLEEIMDVPGCGQATYISVRDKIRLRDKAE